jgi:hypothetical protein
MSNKDRLMADTQANAEIPVQRRSLAKQVRLPRLSGKASAAWLVVCFGLTALLIPMVLRLPRWVDFEVVLAVWWVIWLALLTRLLYTGQRVADDHRMGEPRNWFSFSKAKREEAKKDGNLSWWDGFFWGSMFTDGEGVAVGCLVVLGLIALVGLAWFLIEVAIPLVLFLLYVLTRGMLAQVINDRHHCRGRLGRALGWGLVWSTVFTVPLATAVLFIHFVHQHVRTGV